MSRKFIQKVFGRLVACVIVLAAGFGAMQALAWKRTPPAQRPNVERALRVEAMRVQPESVQVMLEGYGQVRSLDVVEVVPEVAGKVIAVHPRLDVGEVIPQGDVFFEIDSRDYVARRADAQAKVDQLKQTIERWKTQKCIDEERLTTLARNRELAQGEYERIKTLFETDDVGTRSGVDAAERAYRLADDQYDQLAQAVALYPIQIEESTNALESAQASLAMAELSLDRTKVRAPFDARIKRVTVEAGQYVSPGSPVLTVANDAILEISVPLDSREARNWLQFKPGADLNQDAWFNEVEPVTCLISWTEDERGPPGVGGPAAWQGHLNRVERFDEATRTVTVAVRVQGDEGLSTSERRLPLVEGMFCSVQIPGRTIEDVYRLPRYAVGFTGEIFVATGDGRGALAFDRSSVQDPTALAHAILNDDDPISAYLRERVQAPLAEALAQVEQDQRAALHEAIEILDKSEGEGLEGQRAVVDEVHSRLDAYLSAHSPEDRLTEVLVDTLNGVLQDDSLYEEARFADVELPAELKQRLQEPAQADDRVRLNRSLLEAAYPDALGESFRLQSRRVEIVRQQGEHAIVRGALSPGDIVVTTRLVNPLENTLLDVTFIEGPSEVASL